MANTPAVEKVKLPGEDAAFQQIEEQLDEYKFLIDKANGNLPPDAVDGFAGGTKAGKPVPFYSSGARTLIRVGGQPLGVAQSIRWSVSYNATPITTIDTPHPWDNDIGQVRIFAELSQIMDPTKGPEHDAMFAIMQAAVHQPLVDIQVMDRGFGTQIFTSRGMFTEVNGNLAVGDLGKWQVRFVGLTYQHYVEQKFKPYSAIAGAAGLLINGLVDLASDE